MKLPEYQVRYERRQVMLTIDGHDVQVTTRFDPKRTSVYYGDYFLVFPLEVIEGHVEGEFASLDDAFQGTLEAAYLRLQEEDITERE